MVLRLRLKFRNQFHIYEALDANSNILEVLKGASLLFGIDLSNVQLSLNAKDFYGIDNSTLKLSQIGVVSGDIIYIRSLHGLDDIKVTLELELAEPIIRICNELSPLPRTNPCFLSIPLYVFCLEKGLEFSSDLKQCFQEANDEIVRLHFCYQHLMNFIVFTIFMNGNTFSIAGSVQGLPIRKQLVLETKQFLIDCSYVKVESSCNSTFLFKQLQQLSTRIKDDLIEPILILLHAEFGLPKRLSLTNLPMELLTRILLYLPLTSLGRLMSCSRELSTLIRTCDPVWRILLNKLDAKKKPVLDAALSRQQQQQQKHRERENEATTSFDLADTLNLRRGESTAVVNFNQDDSFDSSTSSNIFEAFERFKTRQKNLLNQRRHNRFSPTSFI